MTTLISLTGRHRAGAAVQRDGLPVDVRHRLRAALLRGGLRAAVQVVPAGLHHVRVVPRGVADSGRRLVEGELFRLHLCCRAAVGSGTAVAQCIHLVYAHTF